jgi:NAD(P)-dependent dehydrogenase (short-subunit alcohol dehydrogenase family)
VAVVTGASRGLGAGLAATFAAAGMALGLCARTRPAVPDGAQAISAAVDVTDATGLAAFADTVVGHLGRIDLWVNNAGVLGPVGPLVDADPEAVRRTLEVNVLGVMHGTAVFARHVRQRPGGGVLVNITSGAATTPYEGWAAYCASKAAVDMATAVAAAEEQTTGLRAYALSPGVVDTDMQERIRSTPDALLPAASRFRLLHAQGAFNSPEWVARYILGLARGDAGAGTADGGDGVRRRVPDESGSSDALP